jgi:hypothetical protein
MLPLCFAAGLARSRSYSTVIGGLSNTAIGANSLAAGHNAVASHDFSAVLGFDPGGSCVSMGNGTVNVCVVTGGFFVNGKELGSTVNVSGGSTNSASGA